MNEQAKVGGKLKLGQSGIKPAKDLQSWTKVLGQSYICGVFSNAPNKQSRANSSTLGQPLPPAPHLQCWTRVHVISPEFQHCMGEGGNNAI